jgi:lysophospholipid acyltransferase (LPLAT)-like uncharacterized protein
MQLRMINRMSGWLLWLYALVVRLTGRWEYVGLDHRVAALEHGRVIYALWHQDGSYFCAAMARENPRRLSLLVQGGSRLGIFLGFADLAGFRAYATGEREQSMAAMEKVQKDMRAGCWSVITPDGPKGPVRVCKPGIVGIVRAVSGVVLPMSLACSRYVQTRGWDGARVPLPFARFDVRFGPPIMEADYPDDEVLRRVIENNIDACSLWKTAPRQEAA